jgi:hypothetical protein
VYRGQNRGHTSLYMCVYRLVRVPIHTYMYAYMQCYRGWVIRARICTLTIHARLHASTCDFMLTSPSQRDGPGRLRPVGPRAPSLSFPTAAGAVPIRCSGPGRRPYPCNVGSVCACSRPPHLSTQPFARPRPCPCSPSSSRVAPGPRPCLYRAGPASVSVSRRAARDAADTIRAGGPADMGYIKAMRTVWAREAPRTRTPYTHPVHAPRGPCLEPQCGAADKGLHPAPGPVQARHQETASRLRDGVT